MSSLRPIALVVILALVGATNVTAQNSRYAADFLNIPVGSKPLSMGGAFTALANDESAFYWNPAGVSLIEGKTVGLMFSSEFGTPGSALAEFWHAGFTLPMPATSVAINWVRLSVGDIRYGPDFTTINITQERQKKVREYYTTQSTFFSDVEDAVTLSVSRNNKFVIDWGWFYFKQPIEVPVGVNFKYISQRIGDHGSASGIGVDVGAMLRFSLGQFLQIPAIGDFALGLNVTDVLDTKLTWSTERQHTVPRRFVGGLAYTHKIPVIGLEATLTADVAYKERKTLRTGIDVSYKENLSVRAGYDRGLISTGAGLNWQKKFKVDYSLLLHQDLGAVHRLSTGLNIDNLFDLNASDSEEDK